MTCTVLLALVAAAMLAGASLAGAWLAGMLPFGGRDRPWTIAGKRLPPPSDPGWVHAIKGDPGHCLGVLWVNGPVGVGANVTWPVVVDGLRLAGPLDGRHYWRAVRYATAVLEAMVRRAWRDRAAALERERAVGVENTRGAQ